MCKVWGASEMGIGLGSRGTTRTRAGSTYDDEDDVRMNVEKRERMNFKRETVGSRV